MRPIEIHHHADGRVELLHGWPQRTRISLELLESGGGNGITLTQHPQDRLLVELPTTSALYRIVERQYAYVEAELIGKS